MKLLAGFVLVLGCAGISSAEVKFRIFKGVTVAGYARIDQRLTQDGGKFVHVVMRLKRGQQNLVISSQSTFDHLGAPVRLLQMITPEGKPPSLEKIANFTNGEATVVIRQHGIPRTFHVPLEDTVSPNNGAEFWFLRENPERNATIQTSSFNMDTLEWELSESKFMGDVPTGHHVMIKRGSHTVDVILDDQDLPISMDDSTGYRFVRL